MENEVIVNIDLSTLESQLSNVLTEMTNQYQKLIELQDKFIQFHEFVVIALGFIAGLMIGYFIIKVAFSGD